jgi:hypothetical protein
MIETLESREFMSVTLPASDGLVLEATAEPTTVVDATAESKTTKPKPRPSEFTFVHHYDKASPVLM